MRAILIGVHLEPEDAADEQVVTFQAAGLTVSAIEISEESSTADPAVLKRAVETRARLLDRATFIAIRYGAPVRSSEEIVDRIGARAARWRELLTERRSLVEITLKVAPDAKATRPDRTSVTSGKEYLTRLHEMRQGTLREETRAAAERAFAFAEKLRWSSRQDGGSEMVALVRRDRVADVRHAGEMLRDELADVAFVLSGPWPLEVFGEE